MNTDTKINIAFFGGEPLAVPTLKAMREAGFLPTLIVCNPDRPVGRKQILTPPPTKTWALENGVEVFQPESVKASESLAKLGETSWDLFVVVAYNKIMPRTVLDIPKNGTLNVHPSLLPKLRGASPIRSAILQDLRETGITIMLMDEKMDHGPIIQQEKVTIPEAEWPLRGRELDTLLAEKGASLLVETIPKWLAKELTPTEQDHDQATLCSKITKAMGEISLADDPYQNYLKFCAFDGWPGVFYFENDKRIKITDAKFENGKFVVKKIVREGEKETNFKK